MTQTDITQADAVRAKITDLIAAGTTFDIDALEQIYHDDLSVLMTNMDGDVNKADKAAFKGLFEAKKAAGDPPLNTWAAFDDIRVTGDAAHVLVRRRVKLMDIEEQLTLSIDLTRQNGDWKVLREVIFARPL